MGTAEAGDVTGQLAAERRGLLAHCYRMLGSWDEAEDAVQETSLRAWRGRDGFAGRSSVRVWLYRIATNVCLTALDGRNRRALPSGLGAPSDDPAAEPVLAGPETWIQPFRTDPADVVAARADLRLALIAGLQHLPPRQRAVLLLREVLAFPAAEVAEMLDLSVPAVKSALQRARARLEEVAPTRESVVEPTAARARELLDGYMAAWETRGRGGLRAGAALGRRPGGGAVADLVRRQEALRGVGRAVPGRAGGLADGGGRGQRSAGRGGVLARRAVSGWPC